MRLKRRNQNNSIKDINYEILARHIVAMLKEEEFIAYGKITEAIVEADVQISKRRDEKVKKHLKHRLNLIKHANGAFYMTMVMIAIYVLFELWHEFAFSNVDILVEKLLISILMIVIVV